MSFHVIIGSGPCCQGFNGVWKSAYTSGVLSGLGDALAQALAVYLDKVRWLSLLDSAMDHAVNS